jgi:glutamate racemase
MRVLINPPHIGLFDSGIGGLSVLRALRRHLPGVRCSYIADTAFTPWGDRPASWVVARCVQLSAWLIDPPSDPPSDPPGSPPSEAPHAPPSTPPHGAGADLVLVACNTGTTQAIAALRTRWPAVPFVGVEPGIKPAVAASHKRRVAVMATRGTLASPRLRQLVDHHAGDAQVLRLPCPGLVEAIERADEGDATLSAQLDEIAATLRAADVDTVVLGCTHYPLIADALQQRLGPAVQLIDTADAVARRVASLLPSGQSGAATTAGPLRLLATGDLSTLQRAAQRWLATGEVVERLALPSPDTPRNSAPRA